MHAALKLGSLILSLPIPQKNYDNNLQTVQKTLRTPKFNQAWKNYKKDSSMQNPYDQMVDKLYAQNSSVATYVKDITKEMRTHAVSKATTDNPLKEDIFGIPFQTPPSPQNDWAEKKKQMKENNVSVCRKNLVPPPSITYQSEEVKKLLMPIESDIKCLLEKCMTARMPITFTELDPKTAKIESTGMSVKFDENTKVFYFNIKINKEDFEKIYSDSKISDHSKQLAILGIIEHEIAHGQYFHNGEALFYPIPSKLHHVQEYEADWYWARKNKNHAVNIATLQNHQKNTKPYKSCYTHPSTIERCKNSKEILRLKEAESRWIWGPKGFERYGDPAFEKALNYWSDKQK